MASSQFPPQHLETARASLCHRVIYRRWRWLLLLPMVCLLGLVSCYFPARFTADISIARNGTYEAAYSGDLIWVPFYQRLRQGSLRPGEEDQTTSLIIADLKRESAVKSVRYLGYGRFHTEWRSAGDLLAIKMLTFVRRDAPILSLKYLKDDRTIVVAGYGVSQANDERLRALGLGDESGVLRIRTDARVREHNATSVEDGGLGIKIYAWRIAGLSRSAPRLVIALR